MSVTSTSVNCTLNKSNISMTTFKVVSVCYLYNPGRNVQVHVNWKLEKLLVNASRLKIIAMEVALNGHQRKCRSWSRTLSLSTPGCCRTTEKALYSSHVRYYSINYRTGKLIRGIILTSWWLWRVIKLILNDGDSYLYLLCLHISSASIL